ncbi:Signal recognition particle subunit SRP72 [Bienertia sinuspersici]
MAPKAKEKPKTTVSQPAIAIEDLFTSLNKFIERSDYEQAVKVAEQVLSAAPGDEDALRCKIVALIKDDNIDKALEVIQSSQKLPSDLSFSKAYCLYRLNKLDEALESLKSQESNTATMLLESQILYRLGRMDSCVEVYQKLQNLSIDSLEINFVAALVGAGRSSEVQRVLEALKVKPTSSFELAYNTACSLIERNNHTDAEQLLLSARRVGQESLMEDNWADDDIENELSPIAVQLAYVQQVLGNSQEAVKAYLEMIKHNLADESSLAIATNNLIVLRGPKEVSDSLKKLDRLIEKGDGGQFWLTRALDSKLSVKQKEVIYVNRALLLLHANKIDQARELVTALVGMFPDTVTPVLLQAAVHVKENKAGRAEEVLRQYAGSTLTSQRTFGDIDGAGVVLDNAIKWWSNAMTEDNKVTVIRQEAASFKLKHGRQKEALELFEELVKKNSSVDALVGLVTTAAHVNVEKAEAYEKKLKSLPGLKGINVDALEATSGAKPTENGSRLVNIEGHDESKRIKQRRKGRESRDIQRDLTLLILGPHQTQSVGCQRGRDLPSDPGERIRGQLM